MKTASLILGTIGAVVLSASAVDEKAPAFDWEAKKIGEIEYVPLDRLASFYKFGEPEIGNDGIRVAIQDKSKKSGVELLGSVGSKEIKFNRVKFILGNEILEQEGKIFVSRRDLGGFIDPILRPIAIKDATTPRTVILDPGSPPQDGGADHALNVVTQAKAGLEEQGFKVVLTREDGRRVPSAERVATINRTVGAAIVISLKFADDPKAPRGIRTIALDSADGKPSASVALGTAVHGSVIRLLGGNSIDNGLARDGESDLAGIRHPAITLWAGNIADDYEKRLVAHEKFQFAVSESIVKGVRKYEAAVSHGPSDQAE